MQSMIIVCNSNYQQHCAHSASILVT